MTRYILAIAMAAAALLALPGALVADELWRPDAPRFDDYDRAMMMGDSHAIKAIEIKHSRISGTRRRARDYSTVVARAVAAYEEAARLRPDAAEPHYRAAEVIYNHQLDESPNAPLLVDHAAAKRALAHWRTFEELAPLDPRATDTLFRRAIVNTKLATEDSLNNAIDNYETLLGRSDLASMWATNVGTWLSNLAETYMMVGRLDDAVVMYRRALEYSNRPLYGYGLAVALDRAELGELAREIMLSYAVGDRLRALDEDGIFFVPEGERYYYLALGYEALGELDQAIGHYQLFLDSGAHPRFQPRARDNIHELLERRRQARPRRSDARPNVPHIPGGLRF